MTFVTIALPTSTPTPPTSLPPHTTSLLVFQIAWFLIYRFIVLRRRPSTTAAAAVATTAAAAAATVQLRQGRLRFHFLPYSFFTLVGGTLCFGGLYFFIQFGQGW